MEGRNVPQPVRVSRRWLLSAAVLGALSAIATTYPLASHLDHAVPTGRPDCYGHKDCSDTLLCIWALGESGWRLLHDPVHLFDGNILHPLRNTLAFSESMLSAALFVGPLNALTGNPILGYNLYYLLTIAVSVIGMFLLVVEITGDHRAGLLAGLLFGLANERTLLADVLPSVTVQWAPWVLYAWLRTLGRPSVPHAVGLALAVVAHMHAGAYHGTMLLVLLCPWALVLFATGPWPVRRWLVVGAAFVVACAVGLALYHPYFVAQDEVGGRAPSFPGVPITYFWGALASPLRYLRSLAAGARRTGIASPVPLLLVMLAAGIAPMRRPLHDRRVGESANLAAASTLLLAAMAVACGPILYVRPGGALVHGPFYFLGMLPGLGRIRVPGRFIMLVAFAGSIVAGIALATIFRRIRNRTTAALVGAVCVVAIVADSRIFVGPIPLTTLPGPDAVPAAYRWLATTPRDTAVLELPYGNWAQEAQYTYLSLYHGRRLMNGYTNHMTPLQDALAGFPDALSLRTLQDAGVSYVLVHLDDFVGPFGRARSARLRSRLPAYPELRSRMIDRVLVVEIPPGRSPAPPAWTAIDRGHWRLSGSAPGAERAADGSLASHWTTQRRQESFLRVDLGEVRTVTGLVLGLGSHVLEYPPRHEIRASRDGVAWEVVVPDTPTLPPFSSYRRDRRRVEVPLALPTVRARYLEIRVPPRKAPGPDFVWGVHELTVQGPR
jgi:F5/8 type C domain